MNDTVDYYLGLSQSEAKVSHLWASLYSTILLIAFSTGLIFTVFGGLLWYVKSQQHTDKILAMQAYQMEIELNSKSKAAGRIHFEPRNLPRKQV